MVYFDGCVRRRTDFHSKQTDTVYIERSEIEVSGEYDLEGLFIRLGQAIDSIGAKRVVLDTVESLFAGLPNQAILRAELRRLFRWLKDKGVTAIITGERGDGMLTRQGLEEYASDCVIVLDHRVPLQTIKIDRSFIITMLTEPDVMTLVQTIISLAHALRLKVVAEGVDSEERAKMLRLLHCDQMQGYLFSKPLPRDQMTALLEKRLKNKHLSVPQFKSN